MKTKEKTESPEREEVEAMSRKEEVETLNRKPRELTDEELEKVSGGNKQREDDLTMNDDVPDDGKYTYF